MSEEASQSVDGLESRIEVLEEELQEELREKAAHPLELFFDLVFVFAITQVVSLIVHDLSRGGILRGALVLALMWWAWTNWTWTSNVVDLEPRAIRVAILVSMLGVFGMAFAVPTAFLGDGDWLAYGYVLVRVVAAVVFVFGTRHDAAELKAVLSYLPISLTATAIVFVGGLVGGESMQWIWFGAISLELLATASAGQTVWKVDAGHFAERHGLILIIALGEGIIAVGVALEGEQIGGSLALLLGAGLAGVAAMWWAYFDRQQEVMETALRQADAQETGRLARDVYSLLHYPMILGIVFYAVSLEEAFHHPNDPMETVVGVLFVVSVGLFLLAQAVATWRCWRTYLYERVLGVVTIAALVALWSGDAKDVVVVATVILIATLTAEYMRFRSRIRGEFRSEESEEYRDV
jgi:low temperature requirement protein LtrA